MSMLRVIQCNMLAVEEKKTKFCDYVLHCPLYDGHEVFGKAKIYTYPV